MAEIRIHNQQPAQILRARRQTVDFQRLIFLEARIAHPELGDVQPPRGQ